MPYQKSKRYITVWILAIMMVIGSLFPCYASAETGQPQRIRVGYFQLDGFNDISKDGHYSGYGYEYLMEIAKYTGWAYELVDRVQEAGTGKTHRMSYEEAMSLLAQDKLDLVCHVEKTADNQERFLFPDFPLGEDYGNLTVAEGSSLHSVTDLKQVKGLRVGMISATSRKDQLQIYGKEHGLAFEPVFFPTVEEMKEALLKSHTVDAIYVSNMRQIDGERVLLRLNPQDFFAVTNKNRPDLAGQLSLALSEITAQYPQFASDLHKKYYARAQREPVIWTEEEQTYLDKHPVVRVGVDGDFVPIEYYDQKKGETAGIAGDLLRQIAGITGLKFESVPYDHFRSILKEDGSYGVDLLPVFGADYQWAEDHRVRLTSGYLNIPVSVVSQYYVKDYEDPHLKVAVVREKFLAKKVQDTMHYEQLVYCDSLKGCIDAVNSGKADLTYLPTYSADYFSSQAAYTRIRTYAVPNFDYQVCFAVPEGGDPVFYKILNKAINSIPPKEIDHIVFSNIVFDGHQDSFFDYVYKYPVLTSLAICFLWLGIFLVLYGNRRLEKQVRQELRLSAERMYLALEQTNMVVWDYDLAGNCLIRTKGSKSWLWAEDRMDNVPESLIEPGYVHPDSVRAFENMFVQIRSGCKVASGVFQLKKIESGGRWAEGYIWVEIKMTNIFDEHGKAVRALGLAEDVTEKVQEEVLLREKASRDPLTQLLNRTSFQACVQDFLKKEYREDQTSALIILDTDDFKQVNDTHGHVYGDEVLKAIASKLTALFRTDDYIGRLGGDEFIIFMKNASSPEAVEQKARQICDSLIFEKDRLVTTCSVGVGVVPSRDTDYTQLYRCADQAMYEAKNDGKCRYVVYKGDRIIEKDGKAEGIGI